MLGVAGAVLRVELPHSDDEQQFAETSSFGARFDPRSHVRVLFRPCTLPLLKDVLALRF